MKTDQPLVKYQCDNGHKFILYAYYDCKIEEKKKRCPICGSKNWEMLEYFFIKDDEDEKNS